MTKQISALCASACVLVMAAPAVAQQVSATDGSRLNEADADETTLQEIILVTGSRVVQDGRDTPTPVTVSTIKDLETLTPSNIPDALNKLPQLAGSTRDVGSGNGSGSGRANTYNGNFLNLRAVGAIRTLILQDNRRVPPTAINGQVDTNTLPQMLVERVEIVTGGASAVYGSDAVTGVVNFILDKDFTGFKTQMQGGVSERGDARSTKVGVAAGMDVFDRGHFVASFEHYSNDGIESHADRNFSRRLPVYTGAGTPENPYVYTENARISNVSDGGLALSGPFAGQQFVGTGTLAPFDRGTPTGTSSISIGGDGSYFRDVTLSAPLRTLQGFGRFDYELSDAVSAYVQVSAAEGRTDDLHNPSAQPATYTIYSGNAFLPAAAQAQLTTTPSFQLGRLNNDLFADASIDQKTRSVYATAGLSGIVFSDLRWDAYYTHGQARLSSITHNNINHPHLYAALDTVRDAAGNVVCRVSITHPGLYPGCVPINMFGVGNQTQEAKEYIYGDTTWQATNTVEDFAASIAGEIFETWAGPVSMALNVEYRTQKLEQVTNASSVEVPDFTGIRLGGRAPTTVWAYPVEPDRQGDVSVWEGGGEALIPLLEGVPVVNSLAFNGAVRYTDYSSSGSVTTWKGGLVYEPIPDLRIRAVRSRDIRAPTVSDLYSGQSVTFGSINDPHTGRTAIVDVVSSGNPNLEPEVASTTTVGFVYQPSWLPDFALSFDYFDIRIDDAIGVVSGLQQATLLECERSGGTASVCATIVRPLPFSDTSAANFPLYVRSQSLNVAEVYTRGFDVEMSYRFALDSIRESWPGSMNLRLLMTHQPELTTRATPSSPLLDAAGAVGMSDTRIAALIGYENGPFTLGLQVRYGSGQERTDSPDLEFMDPPLPSIHVGDLSMGYRFEPAGHGLEMFLAVNNVLDEEPRIAPRIIAAGTPGIGPPAVNGDDLIGRFYTVGFRFAY
jgi:iron complex outermembrane recepter protein